MMPLSTMYGSNQMGELLSLTGLWEFKFLYSHPGMVCLCGRAISDNLRILLRDTKTLTSQSWQNFAGTLYDHMFAYNTFYAMYRSLLQPNALEALFLLQSRFAGFLDDVQQYNKEEAEYADFLTAEGVLARPSPLEPTYRMSSAFVDGFIRTHVLPAKFRNCPSQAPPCDTKTMHVLEILTEALKYFDKDLIRLAANCSYKTPGRKIPGLNQVPRESVYDTELMRILMNWVHHRNEWTVTGQWHQEIDQNRHKYSDIVLKNKDMVIVLELLATGDPGFVSSRITKTPEYMSLLSAKEGWVVHFTCEQGYSPIWQSDAELQNGVNVVHFSHDPDFTRVGMDARWKDHMGNVQKSDGVGVQV